MSGAEPFIIGAALGAGAAGLMGGNPLQGALLGAAGGGLGGLAGGAGGAVGGTAGGATGGTAGSAVGGTAGGVTGGAGGAVAQAFPVAMSAPVAATPLPAVGAGTASSATSSLTGNLLADMQAMDAAMAATGEGFAQTAGAGAGFFDKLDPTMLMQTSSLLGDGRSQQQRVAASGGVRKAQAPNVQKPIDELMRMQMMAQRQRRPISLLG